MEQGRFGPETGRGPEAPTASALIRAHARIRLSMKRLSRLAAVCTALSLLSTSVLAQGADDCSLADDLMSNLGSFPFDTNNCSDTMAPATSSPEQQCFSLTEDVWFRWTATMALDGHIVRFDTCNTANYDTEIAIWEGGNCGTAIGLGCNDDTTGCAGLTSQIDWTVTGGTTYLIQLGYWSNAGGVFGSGTMQISDQGLDPCVAGTDDSLEENDTCGAATTVAAGPQPGLFVSTSDPDFYSIAMNAGEIATVTIVETTGNGSDLDLNSYDPGCALIANSVSDTISISSGNTAGNYVVEVYHDGFGTSNCTDYDMDVAIGPDPCFGMDDVFEENDDCASAVAMGEGMNPGLFVSTTDEDYYTVTVADGDTLIIDILFTDAVADTDLFLYPDFASCQAQEGLANCDLTLACGFSVSDNEQVMWTNNSGGPQTYWVKVRVFAPGSSSCLNYDLNITGADGGLGTNYCAANNNSAGTMALIRAEGSDVAANQDLTLITDGVVPGVPGLYFFGPNQIQVVFGNGFRCVGGSTTRIQPPAFADGMGTTTRMLNFAAPYGGNITSGACLNFQLWYRDNMVGAGFNLSNGLKIQFN